MFLFGPHFLKQNGFVLYSYISVDLGFSFKADINTWRLQLSEQLTRGHGEGAGEGSGG